MTIRVVGEIYAKPGTRMWVVAYQPGSIERFKIYGVSFRHRIHMPVDQQGCTGADIPWGGGLRPFNNMPTVPCQEAVPANNVFTIPNAGVELPPADYMRAYAVTGFAPTQEWLTVVLSMTSCQDDVPAEVTANGGTNGGTAPLWHLQVTGEFDSDLSIPGGLGGMGYLCGYLTLDGTFENIPDGRVTATFQIPFWSGDSVSISGPASVLPGASVTLTYSGNASVAENLIVVLASQPCGSVPQDQPGAIGDYATTVQGAFSIAVTSLPINGVDYQCAWLGTQATDSRGASPSIVAVAQQLVQDNLQ